MFFLVTVTDMFQIDCDSHVQKTMIFMFFIMMLNSCGAATPECHSHCQEVQLLDFADFPNPGALGRWGCVVRQDWVRRCV